MTAQGQRQMTYEQFLAEADGQHAEWVNGEVQVMSPVSIRHQQISAFLLQLMRAFALRRQLGEVLSAPIQMKTGASLPGREPDVLFVASENLGRLKTNHLEGPADLAIEVISPESRLRDRGEKYAEYEAGGVKEYWVLDPEEERADFFLLDETGRYRPMDPDDAGIYRSRELRGFWLQVDDLWQDPLPDVIDRLGDLGLLPR